MPKSGVASASPSLGLPIFGIRPEVETPGLNLIPLRSVYSASGSPPAMLREQSGWPLVVESGRRQAVVFSGALYYGCTPTIAEDLRPSVEGVPHPHLIIQDALLNKSRIPTTVVCGLSSQ